MTALAKTHLVSTSILLPQLTDTLNTYVSINSVSSVKCQLVCFTQGHFVDPPKSQLVQCHPWKAAIEQWVPGFAHTECMAHWCVIGHCMGIMAAHGVSQTRVFATSHPIPPTLHHPAHISPIPSISNTDSRNKWQKYHEIQPQR